MNDDSGCDDSRIERAWFHTLRIPLPHVVFLGDIRIAHREFAICHISTSNGTTGWGATLTRGAPVEAIAKRFLPPLLVKQAADQIQSRWEAMMAWAKGRSDRAVAMRAVSIADIALWDVQARRAKVPVCRALGGAPQRLPILVPAGYRREGEGPEGLRREMEHYAAKQVPAVKLMMTTAGVARAADAIITARKLLGPAVALGIDLLGTAHDAPAAASAHQAVAEAQLDFIEDPFDPADVEKLRALKARVDCKLVTGEKTDDQDDAVTLASSAAIDAARFDATVCGGVTAWMRMHAAAKAQGLPVWPHVFPEFHAHLSAATGQPYVESPAPPYDTLNLSALLRDPPAIRDGHWHMSDRPGWGCDLDRDRLNRYLVNGEP
jgi:L-alanine-DL-glutamate epimerase-like enolase superfamily enzyme